MPQVIQIRRQPNEWDAFGRGIQDTVDKYQQGNIAMAKEQNVITNQMLQHALSERRLADQNTRDDRRWNETREMQQARFAQEDKWKAEDLALRKQEAARAYNTTNRPPQPSYKDMALKAAAESSLVPEDQRTDAHRQAIKLGEMYGAKPQGDFLPMTSGASKETALLNQQWAEYQGVKTRMNEQMQKNPENSFIPYSGGTSLVAGLMPSAINDRMNPSGTPLRGAISQFSSVIMNHLSGAAVSEQEKKRLESFLPTVSDTHETLNTKMEGYESYLKEKTEGFRYTYGPQKVLEHIGGSNATALPPGKKRLKFNTLTGRIE